MTGERFYKSDRDYASEPKRVSRDDVIERIVTRNYCTDGGSLERLEAQVGQLESFVVMLVKRLPETELDELIRQNRWTEIK